MRRASIQSGALPRSGQSPRPNRPSGNCGRWARSVSAALRYSESRLVPIEGAAGARVERLDLPALVADLLAHREQVAEGTGQCAAGARQQPDLAAVEGGQHVLADEFRRGSQAHQRDPGLREVRERGAGAVGGIRGAFLDGGRFDRLAAGCGEHALQRAGEVGDADVVRQPGRPILVAIRLAADGNDLHLLPAREVDHALAVGVIGVHNHRMAAGAVPFRGVGLDLAGGQAGGGEPHAAFDFRLQSGVTDVGTHG